MQTLLIFVIFMLTMMGGLFIFSIGTMKNATANYTWFMEAVEYATHAANEDGVLGNYKEVKSNEKEAKKFFAHALTEFEMADRVKINSFKTVNKGATVHKGIKAMGPGYFAEIEVKVLDAHVPLVGQQELWIPMSYYAVVNTYEF